MGGRFHGIPSHLPVQDNKLKIDISLLLLRLAKIMHVVFSPQLFKALYTHRVLAGTEHRSMLTSGLATVVDVGASRGQFALAAREWANEATIISFEPLADPADRFRKVFQHDPGVTLFQAAVGPRAGETTIHVSAADDSSSLLPIGPSQEQLFPGTHKIRQEAVKIGPLSDFVNHETIVSPAMLKLDVQGYELEALRGCEELLGRFAYVYVECSFVELYVGQAMADDVVAWLHERGWNLSGVYNVIRDRRGKRIQADFFFRNSNLGRSTATQLVRKHSCASP
jgi:FkbM family methyltransferase